MNHGRPGQRAVVRPHPQEAAGPRFRVHPQRRLSARTLLLGAAVLAFVVLAGAVAIQAERIEAQRTIDRLNRDLVAAEAEQRHLRAEVATAASPARILEAAAELDLMEPAAVVPLTPVAPAALDRPPSTNPTGSGASASADLAEGASVVEPPGDSEVTG